MAFRLPTWTGAIEHGHRLRGGARRVLAIDAGRISSEEEVNPTTPKFYVVFPQK